MESHETGNLISNTVNANNISPNEELIDSSVALESRKTMETITEPRDLKVLEDAAPTRLFTTENLGANTEVDIIENSKMITTEADRVGSEPANNSSVDLENEISKLPFTENESKTDFLSSANCAISSSANLNCLPGTIKSEFSNTDDSRNEVHTNADTKSLASLYLKNSKLLQNNSLGMLASQYMSDDDNQDTVIEVKKPSTSYRTVSDSDSSDSDIEFIREFRNRTKAVGFDPDNEDGSNRTEVPRVRGEMTIEDLPPVRDLSQISVAEHECIKLGKVDSIVGQLVLVDSSFITIPLDLETILFRNNGSLALGEIFDVLGQVAHPLYCVRFNSNDEIKAKGIEIGEVIYLAPRSDHTKYVILSHIAKMRGSDASWEHDVEPPERYVDYSDDEEERAANRMMKKMHLQEK